MFALLYKLLRVQIKQQVEIQLVCTCKLEGFQVFPVVDAIFDTIEAHYLWINGFEISSRQLENHPTIAAAYNP